VKLVPASPSKLCAGHLTSAGGPTRKPTEAGLTSRQGRDPDMVSRPLTPRNSVHIPLGPLGEAEHKKADVYKTFHQLSARNFHNSEHILVG
jgi:hypothetical protein